MRERCSAHDPGRVIADLAVMLADGGRRWHRRLDLPGTRLPGQVPNRRTIPPGPSPMPGWHTLTHPFGACCTIGGWGPCPAPARPNGHRRWPMGPPWPALWHRVRPARSGAATSPARNRLWGRGAGIPAGKSTMPVFLIGSHGAVNGPRFGSRQEVNRSRQITCDGAGLALKSPACQASRSRTSHPTSTACCGNAPRRRGSHCRSTYLPASSSKRKKRRSTRFSFAPADGLVAHWGFPLPWRRCGTTASARRDSCRCLGTRARDCG